MEDVGDDATGGEDQGNEEEDGNDMLDEESDEEIDRLFVVEDIDDEINDPWDKCDPWINVTYHRKQKTRFGSMCCAQDGCAKNIHTTPTIYNHNQVTPTTMISPSFTPPVRLSESKLEPKQLVKMCERYHTDTYIRILLYRLAEGKGLRYQDIKMDHP